MKRMILAVAVTAVPVVALGAAYEITIDQRNASNTAWLQRIPANPPGTNSGMFWIDGNTKILKWVVPIGAVYDDLTNTLTFNGVQSDWNATSGPTSILNRPTLATVATSGAYNDLTGKPAIPAAQVQTDWNAVSGMGALLNKPSLAAIATTGEWDDINNRPNFGLTALTNQYTDLDGLPSLFDGTWASLSGKPAWTGTFTGAYSSLTGIPSTFTPAAHTHAAADIVSGTLDVARIPALPISQTTGLQTALDGKFPTPAGTTAQYVRGNGTLATFPTIPGAYAIGTPTTRSLSLATAYQCTNTAQPCLFTITLQSQSSISLGGAVNNEGQIVLGSTNAVASGTGTALVTYKNNLGGTLVVGLNLSSQQANSYVVPVPAGWYLAVRQTSGSGLQVVSAFDQQTN